MADPNGPVCPLAPGFYCTSPSSRHYSLTAVGEGVSDSTAALSTARPRVELGDVQHVVGEPVGNRSGHSGQVRAPMRDGDPSTVTLHHGLLRGGAVTALAGRERTLPTALPQGVNLSSGDSPAA